MKLETFFELSNSDMSMARNVAYVIFKDLLDKKAIDRAVEDFYERLDPADFGATWDNNPYGIENPSGSGCWDTSAVEDDMWAKAREDLIEAIKQDGCENYFDGWFVKYDFDYDDPIEQEILNQVGLLIIKELEK